jgi:IS30 family transposase
MDKYSHLSTEERLTICQGIHEGRSLADIARSLGRSKSTLSRELRRNGTGLGASRIWPNAATTSDVRPAVPDPSSMSGLCDGT